MRKLFKSTLAAVLLIFISFAVNAQAVDMGLGSPQITPGPASFPGNVTIKFTIVAEILDQTLSSDDLSSSFASVNVSLSGVLGSANLMPTGDGADLFTWSYNPITNSYSGLAKDVTMVADQIYNITFTDIPVSGVYEANQVGFLANLTPPGDLWDSQVADDDVRIYTSSVLPVTLVSFDVQSEGKTAMLNWSTTEESNSSHFEVERSVNGKKWNKIGKVNSHGESTTLRKYNYVDATPVNGENLYRLRMVDLDGTFAYSSIRSVKMEGVGEEMSVYPNPSSDFIKLRDTQNVDAVTIFDLNGKAVYQSGKAVKGEISVKNLATGMYTVRIETKDGAKSVQKLVVAK
jgi:hypothetical protein